MNTQPTPDHAQPHSSGFSSEQQQPYEQASSGYAPQQGWDDEPTERLVPAPELLDPSFSGAGTSEGALPYEISTENSYSSGTYDSPQVLTHAETASGQLLTRVRQRAAHHDGRSLRTPEYPQENSQALNLAETGTVESAQVIAQREKIPEEIFEDEWDEWETPAKTRAFRWKIPPYAVFLLALAVLGLIFWGVLGLSPTPQTTEDTMLSAQATPGGGVSASSNPHSVDTSSSPSPGKSGTIRVHVAGAVNTPGVQTLPADARAVDALNAAGGATPDADLNRVNLAGGLSDGTQLYIPKAGESAPPALAAPAGNTPSVSGSAGAGSNSTGPKSSAGGGQQAAQGSPVNLNTATAAELQTLPRIGPALANRIIEWRDAHGGFKSVDELDSVPGIGPTLMSSLRPLVTV